jgi:predicted CoA-binding protein
MQVAIIGATKDRSKFGNKAVRAYVKRGWRVFPINDHESSIENLRVYKKLSDINFHLDRILLYVPPHKALELIPDFKQASFDELYVNPGVESDELINALRARRIPFECACGIRAVGENPADYGNI